ncbi:MAG: outer membrane lipoprotein carrier protein LolA [Acidobacteria bacterium]|nr:outer membrane lipoprotein carrier protein LolA [Acidobacteriota bacterium]
MRQGLAMNPRARIRRCFGRFACALGLAWMCTGLLPAEESPAFRQFLDHFWSIQALEADFRQEVTTTFGEETATGILWLQRPASMRWEYRDPEEKLFILRDREYILYTPVDRQVLIQELEPAEIAESPLAFLLGDRNRLPESFAVETIAAAPGQYIFLLTQKEPRTPFDKVVLHVSGPDYLLEKLTLYENNGTVHVYRFSNIRLRDSLSGRLFRFQAPSGIDVLREF